MENETKSVDTVDVSKEDEQTKLSVEGKGKEVNADNECILAFESIKKQNEDMLNSINRLQKEVFYNRLVFALFFLAAMYYIDLKTTRLGDVIGTLIEMFMPG